MTIAHDTNATRWLPGLLFVLAGLLAANSMLGPLGLETIEYRYSESLINQGIGLDAIALIGAVPVAIWAARLVIRRHPAGPVLAFIPGTFAAYMAPQYIVGPEYLVLPGNNERFFVFHLALFVAGIATTVVAWHSIDRSSLEPSTAQSDRRRSLVLFGVVAFIFGGRWIAGIVDLLGGEPTNLDYQENPTAYLLIGVLDLGIVVPAALAAALGLRRHASWARTAAYAVIGWFALVPAAVAAMAIVMQVNDDPNTSTGATAGFVLAAIVFTLGAASLYRPILQPKFTDGAGQPSLDLRSPRSDKISAHQGERP